MASANVGNFDTNMLLIAHYFVLYRST